MSKLTRARLFKSLRNPNLDADLPNIFKELGSTYNHNIAVEFMLLREKAGYVDMYKRRVLSQRKEMRSIHARLSYLKKITSHDITQWVATRHVYFRLREKLCKKLGWGDNL